VVEVAAGAGVATGATCVCGVTGEAGAVELTSGPAAFFWGIWIPVKILETSFCNPGLLLAIVQLPCGSSENLLALSPKSRSKIDGCRRLAASTLLICYYDYSHFLYNKLSPASLNRLVSF
jgi:hypothetical protein